MKISYKKTKEANTQVSPDRDKKISIGQIFACFVVVNLILINIINYWQPFNKAKLNLKDHQIQNALISVYDLQRYFNDFKSQPDINSYTLVQKSIKLINNIESIEFIDSSEKLDKKSELNKDSMELNKVIAEASAAVPSFRTYQQQLDKIIKINKDLKQVNLDNLDNLEIIKNKNNKNINNKINNKINNNKINLIKSLLATSDKINNLLLVLKYNYWSTQDNISKYQNIIEEIGLEIEQINNYLEVNKNNNNNNNQLIISNLNELFNNLNLMMPMLLKFSEINNKLNLADKYLINIIDNLKYNEAILIKEINEKNNFDDKTIVILTLLGATVLLLVLIILAKATDKTKKIYTDYKNKKEIYLLSHNTHNNQNTEKNDNKDIKTNNTENTVNSNNQKHYTKKQIHELETVE